MMLILCNILALYLPKRYAYTNACVAVKMRFPSFFPFCPRFVFVSMPCVRSRLNPTNVPMCFKSISLLFRLREFMVKRWYLSELEQRMASKRKGNKRKLSLLWLGSISILFDVIDQYSSLCCCCCFVW